MNTTYRYLKIKAEGENAEFDFIQVKESSLILRALNNKLRQNILKLLEKRGQSTVSQISAELLIEHSMASQQLAILRRANIVKTQREGKCIYYDLHRHRLVAIGKCVTKLS